MVALPTPFNARSVEPASGFQPLPPGWYDVIIVQSEFKTTKSNDGGFVALDRKVINADDRSMIGRTFVERLNLHNKSEQAVHIAQRALSAICHITGVFDLVDTAQLHNIPHRVRVDVTVNDQGKPNGNNVMEYADQNGNPPHKAGAGPQMASVPQQAPAPVQQAPAPVQHQAPAPQPQPQPAQPAAWGAPPAANGAAPPAAWGAPPPGNGAAPPPVPAWGAAPATAWQPPARSPAA